MTQTLLTIWTASRVIRAGHFRGRCVAPFTPADPWGLLVRACLRIGDHTVTIRSAGMRTGSCVLPA